MHKFNYIQGSKIFTHTILSIFILSFFFLFGIESKAQTFPATFSYQAVARNADGKVVANKMITIEVSILQGSNCESGGCSLVWQEIHFPTTSDLGIFSINIGEGQSTFAGSAADFESIPWSDFTNGNYYMKIRADFGTGETLNELLDMGTVKLQSVPYALATQKCTDLVRSGGKVPISISELNDVNISSATVSQVLSWNGTNWVNADPSATGAVTLDELTDVVVSGPALNDVLSFDGTNWVNSPLTLEELSNVNLTSPSLNQVLTYNGTNWVNSTPALANLTDVTITSPTSGQSLVWNGTAWVNQSPSNIWTDDGTYVFYNGAHNVGIGTATPRARFELATTLGEEFLVSGSTSANTGYSLTAGSWMKYTPSLGVFRAGAVTGTQWSNANTGNYSSAFGLDNTASNLYTFAAGYNNIASNTGATVFGRNNTASGVSSFAAGNNNTSSGIYSFSVGNNNTASGNYSFVFGSNNQGFADLSLVFGLNNYSSSYASLVLGRYNDYNATNNNTTWISTEPILVIGNGSDASNKNNALVIYKNGNISTEGTLAQSQTNPNKAIASKDFLNILKLNAYTEMKSSGLYVGFSGDEVKKLFPSFVVDFNKTQNIKYIQFIPLMIETLKYQQQEIESLKTENQELQKRLINIEQRLNNLENK